MNASTRRRLDTIEEGLLPQEPRLEPVIAERQRLLRWLSSVGLTVEEALAAGRTPPPEQDLRFVTLADLADAAAHARRYHQERRRGVDEDEIFPPHLEQK